MNTFVGMGNRKALLPNAITSANLLCGCIAITLIANQELLPAAIFILLGAFFDFFDGMAARLLNAGSAMGAELDSLADVVTFGVAPAYLIFSWLGSISESYWNYVAFLLAIFSAIRLAKFNVDDRQTTSFIGLPTPANALFWISIPLIVWQDMELASYQNVAYIIEWYNSEIIVYALIIIFSYLLVAELPLMALKFKNIRWKENQYRFLLILFSLILIGIFLFAAIPFIILLYLILSIVENYLSKHHEIQSGD